MTTVCGEERETISILLRQDNDCYLLMRSYLWSTLLQLMKKNIYILLACALSSLLNIRNGNAQVSNLDSTLTSYMNSLHSPGLSALILKKGIPVWMNAYGYANLEDSIPVTMTTDFMLASISKTITATALMNVYENGGFNLDDNIDNYLPFSVINPDYPDDSITFRQLLTHTSSLKDNWIVLNSLYFSGDAPIPLGEYLEDYFTPGGQYYDANKNFYNYAPGADFNYCNEAVALCGYLVETITGTSFNQYCKDSIFIPLCMDQTAWFLSELDTFNIAMPYSWQSNSYHAEGYYGYPDYPDGQLRTNAIAMARFLDMYMNNGKYNEVRILDSSTVAMMLTIQFPSIENTQGLVWYKKTIGGRSCWGHDGGDAGVSTNMYFSPADSTGIILLSNGDNYYSNTAMDAMFDYAETIEPEPTETFNCDFATFVNHQNQPNDWNPIAFPNPSNGFFNLKLNGSSERKTELKIYNLVGDLILQKQISQNQMQLNLSQVEDGVYFLEISNGSERAVLKLFKLNH